MPKHPGGALIYEAAGKDCTALFDSYHPLAVRCAHVQRLSCGSAASTSLARPPLTRLPYASSGLLPKYCVGAVAAGSAAAPGTPLRAAYVDDTSPSGAFYATLKARVAAHFRASGADPRFHAAMYVKTALIGLLYSAAFYAAFLRPGTSLAACLAAAVLLGVAKAEVGVSIQHDGNHGAYSPWPAVNAVAGASLDLVGASSFMWRQQHVVGHHAVTNLEALDPDIRVSEADVRRVAAGQPRHWWHAHQHLYLGALYGLLAIKSIFLDDFAALAAGAIGAVSLRRMTGRETAVFWGGKLVYGLYTYALPLAAAQRSLARLALLWTVADLVTGWMLALMFQVAHVTRDVQFPQATEAGSGVARVPLGWGAAQVATSANFCARSWFWTHFSGGLNHQIEHHLFPGINHCHYPSLAPLVQATAKEFGVPYVSYPTFAAALGAHFGHLKNMGAAATVPSLATVG